MYVVMYHVYMDGDTPSHTTWGAHHMNDICDNCGTTINDDDDGTSCHCGMVNTHMDCWSLGDGETFHVINGHVMCDSCDGELSHDACGGVLTLMCGWHNGMPITHICDECGTSCCVMCMAHMAQCDDVMGDVCNDCCACTIVGV